LALAQEALGSDDAYVALVMKDLAEITAATRKPEEARPSYERALQVLTAKLGAEHAQTILVTGYLGQLYIDLDEFSRLTSCSTKLWKVEKEHSAGMIQYWWGRFGAWGSSTLTVATMPRWNANSCVRWQSRRTRA